MAGESSTARFLTVDVRYNGKFSRNPLVYLEPVRVCIKDIDFASMELWEFKTWLQKLIKGSCNDIYYCISKKSLANGIRRLDNDCDFLEFICDGYGDGNDLSMSIYIDHENKPIIDWADKEAVYVEGNEDEVQELDDDKDSEYSDSESYEHEDDVGSSVPTFNNTVGDAFLHKLSGIPILGDVESDNLPVFPRHNENLEWNKMVPILGMIFSNPLELKHCVTNYAVAGGYDLWYEKNDKTRLLVKCSKGKDNRCPYRLWATWNGERSFQIKTLIGNHNCTRVFRFGSIVTYKWIGMQLRNDILQNPRLSLRKLKGLVSQRFNLIASVGQCKNAKKYALDEIEGTLVEHYGRVWSYGEELRRSNPGSTIKIDVDVMPDGKTYFSKFYVCFKGVKDGWIEGCRRIIGLDGCFTKGVCRGQLLAAVGRDANNQIYPIAWAVVAVENKETWKWFVLGTKGINMRSG
ncbi:hypothetical protein OSB04_017754 [Centaurea solstitialis]|uniref:Transposase MuDR plant domain-containing protein n=1 Tax=Centaurea solstitialis TaxID=347529 RepID=A0AA38T3H3_9ASTR|nr:hypothetical protein OSB04_017754 [Centaurea solstitialis]